MEVVRDEMDEEGLAEAEQDDAEAEGGGLGGNLLALEATEILTQDSDPGGPTLAEARNGLNDLSRLAMLWTVRHNCQAGASFAFNCYRHGLQILLCHPGDSPVILLSREVVAQGDLLLVVLYGITLFPLVEELRDADPTILSPFYVDDVVFDVPASRSAVYLRLLLEWGLYRGYFPDPTNLLCISDKLEYKDAARREFEQTGLNINYVYGS